MGEEQEIIGNNFMRGTCKKNELIREKGTWLCYSLSNNTVVVFVIINHYIVSPAG